MDTITSNAYPEPSRELDALIAVTFFGWRWMEYLPGRKGFKVIWPPDVPANEHWFPASATARLAEAVPWDAYKAVLPAYSTDIRAAWELFTLPDHECWMIQHYRYDGASWFDIYADGQKAREGVWLAHEWGDMYRAPYAICIAALKHKGLL